MRKFIKDETSPTGQNIEKGLVTGSSNSISQVASHSCTPEQKAEELFSKFYNLGSTTKEDAKQCALICVEEQLSLISTMPESIGIHYRNYLQQLKEAITKI